MKKAEKPAFTCKDRDELDWLQARIMDISEKKNCSPLEARPQAIKDMMARRKKTAAKTKK